MAALVLTIDASVNILEASQCAFAAPGIFMKTPIIDASADGKFVCEAPNISDMASSSILFDVFIVDVFELQVTDANVTYAAHAS